LSALDTLRARAVPWLVEHAYPLWCDRGIDDRTGGFVEALSQNGAALDQPRRARVHPRQVFAFAQARTFGWKGDVPAIARRGMDYFITHYQRRDGLFRALVGSDGAPLDEEALLYDQAFALLGYAAAATVLDACPEFERRALDLRRVIELRLRANDGSYLSREGSHDIRESNPHMHLLEAYLAWAEIGRDAGWAAGVKDIVDIALTHFIRKDSGAIGESYLATWQPDPGIAGRLIEPGHQFEWAWLLLRSERRHSGDVRAAALNLISVGEEYGVHEGVAVNALYDDFSVRDGDARLWPQTERLKAALLAASLTDERTYWSMAEAAAASWVPYLSTRIPGLWRDVRSSSGEYADAPAPASTFYHLVGGMMALTRAATDTA
jgi:mannose/cellobiose epimerase-like protein (N-acyl-D-glucosamine 2-epimerase family)